MTVAPELSPAITVEQVTAVHGSGRQARTTLSPTSLSVSRGESVAVIGRSGAGKSTLADVVLGLRLPASGSVTVCQEHWCSATRRPAKRLRSLVQGIPQDPVAAFVPRWTIRRSIERAIRSLSRSAPDGLGEHPAGRDQAREHARDAEARISRAAELAHLEPSLLDKRVTEVSGGQAQRAAIARALAVSPTVLVADEPTSALDPRTSAEVSAALLSIVEDEGIALLLVTHDPEFAARCTRTVEITAPAGDPLTPAAPATASAA
ncbi:ATP-binding cassette domain-containing protein [Brevibacterium album]|uniref:ATP-binding cassette domain-containing protein n=1 Tax=Brevibacterium album TaxID=417948 RepID=UPI0003FF21FF|nr:ATP-binding cassette domain-containing protein [Brevibacterium album]